VVGAYTTARRALLYGYLILKDSREPAEKQVFKTQEARRAELIAGVLPKLEEAERSDPMNANLLLNWSAFQVEQYRVFLPAKSLANMPVIPRIDRARELDPEDTDVYLIPYKLYREHAELLLEQAGKKKGDKKVADLYRVRARDEYQRAAQTLEPILHYDPAEARWHALLAEVYHTADEKKYRNEWEAHAREALRLDAIQRNQPMQPARTLEDAQRDRLYNWLEEAAEAKT
jgi:hypothetical protein